MMYDVSFTVVLVAAGVTVLAAVYLCSKDPDRRHRAWQLLSLLLGRQGVLCKSARAPDLQRGPASLRVQLRVDRRGAARTARTGRRDSPRGIGSRRAWHPERRPRPDPRARLS